MTSYVICYECGTWTTWKNNGEMHDTSQHVKGSEYVVADHKRKVPDDMPEWQPDEVEE